MSKQMSIDDNTHKRLKFVSVEKGLGLSQSIDFLLDLYDESKATPKEIEAKPIPPISPYTPPVIPPEQDPIVMKNNAEELLKFQKKRKLAEQAEIQRKIEEEEKKTPLAPLGRILDNIGVKVEDEETEKTEE